MSDFFIFKRFPIKPIDRHKRCRMTNAKVMRHHYVGGTGTIERICIGNIMRNSDKNTLLIMAPIVSEERDISMKIRNSGNDQFGFWNVYFIKELYIFRVAKAIRDTPQLSTFN